MTTRLFWSAALVVLLACDTTPTAVSPALPADSTLAALQRQPLDYTRHARCRMDCRHINEAAVAHVLAHGTLDPARTRTDGSCPSHAVEAAHGGRDLRVVFAGCPTQTRVVTVIDLDTDWTCTCD
jgi:hypothetical protein